jgi:tetratricopeptide (TPR) repeat protein
MEGARRGKSWLLQARKAHDEGETLSAISALRMAVDADPDNEEARDLMKVVMDGASDELGQRYFEQARAEFEFGEHQLAKASVARALEFSPDRPDVLLVAAKVLLETDVDMHKAYEHAQRATQADPRNAQAHLVLGKVLLKAGLNTRAKSVLMKAVELNPKLTEAETILAGL